MAASSVPPPHRRMGRTLHVLLQPGAQRAAAALLFAVSTRVVVVEVELPKGRRVGVAFVVAVTRWHAERVSWVWEGGCLKCFWIN